MAVFVTLLYDPFPKENGGINKRYENMFCCAEHKIRAGARSLKTRNREKGAKSGKAPQITIKHVKMRLVLGYVRCGWR